MYFISVTLLYYSYKWFEPHLPWLLQKFSYQWYFWIVAHSRFGSYKVPENGEELLSQLVVSRKRSLLTSVLTYLASTVNFACTIPKDKTCNYKDSYFIPVISSSWGGNTFLFLRRQYIMANNIELRIRPPGTPSNLLVMWSKTWYLSFLSLSFLIYELRIIRAPISRFLRRSDGIKSWRPSQNFTQFKSLVNMFVIVAVTDIF